MKLVIMEFNEEMGSVTPTLFNASILCTSGCSKHKPVSQSSHNVKYFFFLNIYIWAWSFKKKHLEMNWRKMREVSNTVVWFRLRGGICSETNNCCHSQSAFFSPSGLFWGIGKSKHTHTHILTGISLMSPKSSPHICRSRFELLGGRRDSDNNNKKWVARRSKGPKCLINIWAQMPSERRKVSGWIPESGCDRSAGTRRAHEGPRPFCP